MLPCDYPKWQSVYYHFRVWFEKGEAAELLLKHLIDLLQYSYGERHGSQPCLLSSQS